MFSPALGRVVRSTAPFTCTLGRVSAVQQTIARPAARQRRLSSSKASVPPNGSNDSSSSSGPQSTTASSTKAGAKKAGGKGDKRKAAAAPALNLPHVPPTSHLDKSKVKLTSFFSLHRPISVTSALPDVVTNAAFDSIFHTRSPYSRTSTMQNLDTLSGGIQRLESALQAHERKEAAQNVHHLDGPPPETLEQIMTQFSPFQPPPPPVPMDQIPEYEVSSVQQETAPEMPVQQRAWSTEVVVTEATDAHGNRTYTTTTAPFVEIEPPTNTSETDHIEIRQPFLERMRQRGRQNTHSGILAISVKRQRKLKMKKHKYKKLMKRTRLLRRKLDRL